MTSKTIIDQTTGKPVTREAVAARFTKDEAEDLRRAVQDIELFLRLADLRIDNVGARIPLKPVYARLAIGWLRALAVRYGHGEDITKD